VEWGKGGALAFRMAGHLTDGVLAETEAMYQVSCLSGAVTHWIGRDWL
jgi:hypothetical protein